MRKYGFINVNGNIGFVLANGEVQYDEFDKCDMNLISEENEIFVIEVKRYTLNKDFFKKYIYTFCVEEGGNLIITDIK